MEKEKDYFNLSKQIDLKVAKISRRHALRILATIGTGVALAWHSLSKDNSENIANDSSILSKLTSKLS